MPRGVLRLCVLTVLTGAAAVFQPALAGDPAAGREVYEWICATCHGAAGIAAERYAPSFARGERLDKPDEVLARAVRDGLEDRMPPWGGYLSEKQIDDVVAYIRTLPRPEPARRVRPRDGTVR